MKILKTYAESMLGTFYSWGGDDPSGFDCSGMVIELLKSCGFFHSRFDTTAQGLYIDFRAKAVINQVSFGSLAFFGRYAERITHVGFMLDAARMLEAGGGGKHVRTREDAIKHNAFIRIRPINTRKDLVAIIKPRYGLSW